LVTGRDIAESGGVESGSAAKAVSTRPDDSITAAATITSRLAIFLLTYATPPTIIYANISVINLKINII
jgi:hypothetical protein